MQRPHRTFGRTVSPTFCAARESGCCWPTIHIGFATQQFGSDRSRDFTPPVPETLRDRRCSERVRQIILDPTQPCPLSSRRGRRSAKKPHQRATSCGDPGRCLGRGIIVLLSSASWASLNLSPVRNLTATETTPGRYYRSLADTFCERLPGQLSNELREIVEVLTASE